MPFRQGHTNGSKLSWRKIAARAGLVAGTLLLVSITLCLLFPDMYSDGLLKRQIIRGLAKAYPAYEVHISGLHYDAWKSRLWCDSITLGTIDSTFSFSADSFSISGISRTELLLKRGFAPSVLKSSEIVGREVVFGFQKAQEELRLRTLYISVPDSEMVAKSVTFHPLVGDGEYFAKSQYRRTRYRFDTPRIELMGLDCLALLQGGIYTARRVTTYDAIADILVDMYKPYHRKSSRPQMPNEALSAMTGVVRVDSVQIIGGQLKYYEQYGVDAVPALLTIDKINVSVSGIASHATDGDTAVVRGEGLLMNTCQMKLLMAIPLASTDFSFRYSGSFGTLDITKLNPFFEPAEQLRCKSGTLQQATFDINVNAGHATGGLKAVYKDLSIAAINEKTGSERGLFDRLSTLIGKLFVVRGSNKREKGIVNKIGEIDYMRNPDDSFTRFAWLALRTGVCDVVRH